MKKVDQVSEQNSIYGGQAVIEGVMMAGKNVHVTAVRKKDGSIDYLEVPKTEIGWVQVLKKIPFVRGIVGIIEASAKGAQHLNFSAEVFAEEQDENSQKKVSTEEKQSGFFSNISMFLGVAVIGVISNLYLPWFLPL
jgi:uncharacterized protein YqhQ